jgi:hypothetical membrane protein
MTHTSFSPPPHVVPRAARTSAVFLVAITGLPGFLAAATFAGAMTSGYSMVGQDISSLAALDAPHPDVVLAGFLLLATGTIATSITVRRQMAGRAATAAAVLFGLAGACLYGSAFAREDCATERAACQALEKAGAVSGHHVVHNLVSLLSFVLAIATLFVLPRALRATDRQQLVRPARIVAISSVLLLLLMLTGVVGPAEGIAQRTFIVLTYGWPLLVATTLHSRGPILPPAEA